MRSCSSLIMTWFWTILLLLASLAGRAEVSPQVQTLEARMSLRQKAGQLLWVGMEPANLDEEQAALVEGLRGGIFLYWNALHSPTELLAFTNTLQNLALSGFPGVPFLVAVDQEGGSLFTQRSFGATVFPGNMALGATGSSQKAYLAAQASARELRAAGIHANFAPVLDVNLNPLNPIIGVRSFGEDPRKVAELGVSAIAGYRKGGIAAFAKHFPGHGDTAVDSHIGLPVLEHPRQRLDRVELYPFRKAVEAGVSGVMVGHIAVSALEDSSRPATLSPIVLGRLLRRELGFGGAVVTDAMEMGGITHRWKVPEAAVLAVEAGADLVLVRGRSAEANASEVLEALVEAVRTGRISPQRLKRSVERVLQLKEGLGLFETPKGNLEDLKIFFGSKAHQDLAQEIADSSVTLVRDPQKRLPFSKGSLGTLGVALPSKEYFQRDFEILLGGLRERTNLQVEWFAQEDAESRVEAIVRSLKDVDAILLGTISWGMPKEELFLPLAKALEKTGKPLLIVSFLNPYDLGKYPGAAILLATYGTTPASMRALAKGLFGEMEFQGKLPVTVPGL
ncbi:MAG: hypothetical protein HY402_03930 [Elusimicrobia bacterium]|nr:hypothetical protein [Elusimicrobiota bacterium]